jgi:competence protein ComEA
MFKKFLMGVAGFIAATGFALAAVEVNTADQAQLESIKGIGPSTAKKIIDERKKGDFKDWQDLSTRVNGVGGANSMKFSQAGLTVNGQANAGVPAKIKGGTTTAKDKSNVKANEVKSWHGWCEREGRPQGRHDHGQGQERRQERREHSWSHGEVSARLAQKRR